MAKLILAWAAHSGSRANSMLNYDFCPWANRYVYWLKKPIGWLTGGILAGLLLGAFVAPQAFAISAALLGLILVGTFWPYLAVRGVVGSIGWSRSRCNEGDEVEVQLTLTNRWPIPLWGLIIEADAEAIGDGRGVDQPLALACVPPFSTSRFTWVARPSRRGVYPQQKSFIATGFPLGLWTARRELKQEGELLVWPKTIALKDLPQLGGKADAVVGAMRDKAGYEGDVIGVRPFRDGDSLRSIHWAQTARRDALIVCERQSKAQQTVVVNIRVSPELPADPQERSNDEWLIRIAASICKEFISHAWGVQLQIGERVALVEAGQRGLASIMDLLARFDWSTEASDGSRNRIRIPNTRRQAEDVRFEIARAEAIDVDTSTTKSQRGSNVRWVAVHRSGGDITAQALWRYRQPIWMLVDLDLDVDPQVQRQWERVCHDTASAAG